ncbi:MAG: hypothetical protein U5K81_01890 [Trueperaceae bacterium]|nr:hypothetical protein [Trueperaceae bacterium]
MAHDGTQHDEDLGTARRLDQDRRKREMPDLPTGPDALRDLLPHAADLRVNLALQPTLVDDGAPRTPDAEGFWRLQGWLDTVHACALDGFPFEVDTVLWRAAMGDRALPERSLEASLVDVHAWYTAERGGSVAPIPNTSGPGGLRTALGPAGLEALASRACGPGTRLRHTRGYQGPIQRSKVLRRPPAGRTYLRAQLAALATWAAPDEPYDPGGPREPADAHGGAPDETPAHAAALAPHAPPPDPLLRAAVVYGRMRLLHPFRQANGRMAVLAVDRALRRVPGGAAARIGLAHELRAREAACVQALRAVGRTGSWDAWVRTFFELVRSAVDATWARWCAYVRAYRAVLARLEGPDGRDLLGRRRIGAPRLAQLLARQPYVGIQHLVAAGVAQRRTAGRYLRALQRLGVIVPTAYGLPTVFRVSAVADALGVKAQPAGRRPGLDRIAAVGRTVIPVDLNDP